MTNDIAAMLKDMDKRRLREGLDRAKRFLSTDEGKAAMAKIKEGKMPDGTNIPDDLKKAAEALSKDPESAKKLSSFLKI